MRQLFITLLLFLLAPAAQAAGPFLLKDHPLHSLDALILESVGKPDAKVVFTAELASITSDQARNRISYQRIGCEPFSVQQDSQVIDEGYQCHTFYCVGYRTGTKICRNAEGGVYGGVVEINRRMKLVTSKEEPLYFSDLASPTREQTKRRDQLSQLQCNAYYLMYWDVAVGEGFQCIELGKYPYFSPALNCVDDWRDAKGYVCDPSSEKDPLEMRVETARRLGMISASSASSAGMSSSSVRSGPPVGFSDVISGYYGYTAIISLAEREVVKGYPDGTFRPKADINRAEFLKMLMAGLFPDKLSDTPGCFPDVARQWFTPYVCGAKAEGWVGGYQDGSFRPGQTLRKAEGLKIVMSALGVPLDSTAPLPIGVSSGDWFTPYVRKAVEMKILLEPSFDPGAWATRADTAVWMYRASKAMNGEEVMQEMNDR